jgi:hypothetical protein
MDRLELALREYEQIAPKPRLGADVPASDRLESWLREKVVPVVEDLQAKSPRFRRLVSWALTQIMPGAQTDARSTVDAVATALVDCAKALVEVSEKAGITERLAGATVSPTTEAAAGLSDNQRTGSDLCPPLGRLAVETEATRPWLDLVSQADFFYPATGLHLREPQGSLSRSFNERFRSGFSFGEHIVRMLIARVEFWQKPIDEAWKNCFYAIQGNTQRENDWRNRLFSAKIKLDQAVEELKKCCLAGNEARLRNACCVLLQVYVAYHPSPTLQWLAPPEDWVRTSGAVLRAHVRHRGEVVTVEPIGPRLARMVERSTAMIVDMVLLEQVAAALHDVAELYRQAVSPEDMIEEAVQSHDLVVLLSPRAVCWKGRKVGPNWHDHPQPWDFLVQLAEAATKGQGVDCYNFGDGVTHRDLSVRKYELARLLPDDLGVLLEKTRSGPCRLALPPEKIAILDLDADAWTVDVDDILQGLLN